MAPSSSENCHDQRSPTACRTYSPEGVVMLKMIRSLSLGFVMLILLQALCGCSGLAGLARSGEPLEVIDSPQSDRMLVIRVNTSRDDPTRYLTLVFEVHDKASGELLHRQPTRASSRMAWSMRWLDSHTVQLDSSDVGTYCWQEQPDATWLESHCP